MNAAEVVVTVRATRTFEGATGTAWIVLTDMARSVVSVHQDRAGRRHKVDVLTLAATSAFVNCAQGTTSRHHAIRPFSVSLAHRGLVHPLLGLLPTVVINDDGVDQREKREASDARDHEQRQDAQSFNQNQPRM